LTLLPSHRRSPVFPYTALFRSRRHVARDVAADRRVLDLDDLGAEVREHLGAEGPRAELRDREDAEAVEGRVGHCTGAREAGEDRDRKSTRLNSSHRTISYAVFC